VDVATQRDGDAKVAVTQIIPPAHSSVNPEMDVTNEPDGKAKVAVSKIIPPADSSVHQDMDVPNQRDGQEKVAATQSIPPAHSSVHQDIDVTNHRDGEAKLATTQNIPSADSSSESTPEPQPFQHTPLFLKQLAKVRKNADRAYASEKADGEDITESKNIGYHITLWLIWGLYRKLKPMR